MAFTSKQRDMNELKKELRILLGDNVYFRDDENLCIGIAERFALSDDHIIAYVICEGGTENVLDYYECYCGSAKLDKIKKKYHLAHDWSDCAVAYLYDTDTY